MKDYSNIPKTCPLIDEVISAIKSVDWGNDSWWVERDLIDIMEKIREYNSALRDWGNETLQQLKDIKRENEELHYKIKQLEYE